MRVTPERYQRAQEVFLTARELEGAARRRYLDRACGDDAALRAEAESLLGADAPTENRFLETPALGEGFHLGDGANEAMSPARATGGAGHGTGAGGEEESVPEQIGPYRLLQKIGEGGFGVVYMAEQTAPVRRRVALKIIKLGMDTERVIARFQAECQALAMMDHPSIAHVLDAGATHNGRPYFVMELVRGVPITEYCDRNRMGTRDRLRLFVRVCEAVQHAHQKGIIHRDIKPSNVMIALHDDRPVVKVIDFGIAKAMHAPLTERTVFTELRQFMGTPEYMSPEQADMGGLDVDTRSDIYSLGVLLYELLTGTTPLESTRLREMAYADIERAIRETEAVRPSSRLSVVTEQSEAAARSRGVEVSELRRTLHGDLDWIVMRALEKDRTRRYGTAAALAADVERYLANEPIAARPPSAAYRVRKFVRRHRAGVGTAALMGLIVVGALVATSVLYVGQVEATRRAETAELAEREGREAAQQGLERAQERESEAQEALKRARMVAEVLTGTKSLLMEGRAEEALEVVDGIIEARRSSGRTARLIDALHFRGYVLANLARASEAEASFEDAMELSFKTNHWARIGEGFSPGQIEGADAMWRIALQRLVHGSADMWESDAMRRGVWEAVGDGLVRQPTATYSVHEVEWRGLRVDMTRHGDATGSVVTAEGIRGVRAMDEPEPGLWAMRLRAARAPGPELDVVWWLLVGDWKGRLFAMGGYPPVEVGEWERQVTAGNSEDRRERVLSRSSELETDAGPWGRPASFGDVWEGRTALPPGRYHVGVVSDDGERCWLDGRKITDAWVGRSVTGDPVVVEVDGGEQHWRVEHFQGGYGWSLRLDVRPLGELGAATLARLGIESDVSRRMSPVAAASCRLDYVLAPAFGDYASPPPMTESEATELLEAARRWEKGGGYWAVDATYAIATRLTRRGNAHAAEVAHRIAHDVAVQVYGAESFESTHRLHGLGSALLAQGRAAEAAAVFEESVRIRREVARSGPGGADVSWALFDWGRALVACGSFHKAVPALRRCLEIFESVPPANGWVRGETMVLLGQAMMGAGKQQEGKEMMRRGVELMREDLAHGDEVTLMWAEQRLGP